MTRTWFEIIEDLAQITDELRDKWDSEMVNHGMVDSRPTGKWIPIKYRKPTEEEKESIPEVEYWFDCELPEHGEEVLITTAYNNSIAMTTFANYGEDGCEFEDWDAEDVIAWCRLPEPYIAKMEE